MIRNSLRVIIIIYFLVIFIGCWSENNEKIVIKVSHNGSDQHPHQAGFEKISEILEKETNGRAKLEIFPSSQIASEEEAIEMVKLGVIGSTPASSGGLSRFVPEVDLFNLPFIFDSLGHFYEVLDGPIGDEIAKKIEQKLDCIVLGWWFSGIRNTWNSEKPIYTPKDLEGMKIRVIGSSIVLDTFNAFGAQATNMSFGELYSAIQQGVLDGAECDHIDLLVEKFYEVTKYVSYTEHLYLSVALIFSNKQLDKLPIDIKEALIKAGKESIMAQRNAMEEKTKDALTELKEKGLVFNAVDKKLFKEKAEVVYEKHAEEVGGMSLINQIVSPREK
ncbi:MAG: C4-dicarboxylate ABC transporter substrate-binding protein [Candidatus Marinimicrobia bacterium]|jgi:tripartite ATP-independent transporter DctP family solute receptor|nr:C4-dicarboxylate ABC transporter substrate-binding protein [Candidatus Neomarinimicrobiota bacterium]